MKIKFCCTASEDYLEKYKRCYVSQLDYCEKNGIDYALDSKPLRDGQSRSEWYWRKLSSTLQYFKDYDYLVIIDIDIEIKSNTPDIRTIIDNNSIFYVNGISNRPNSGFLIIKTDEIGKTFINQVLKNRYKPVAKKFKAPGENGHIIEYLNNNPDKIKELSIEWNCSNPKHMDKSFLLHYTNQLSKYYTRDTV